jgi:beta-glucanase (GH16 family)
MFFRCHGIAGMGTLTRDAARPAGRRQSKMRSTLVLLALGAIVVVGCTVKDSGLALTHAAGAGGAMPSGGAGGSTATGGGGGSGGVSGDAAAAPGDASRLDAKPNTGGAPGTGGISGSDGAVDTNRDGDWRELGSVGDGTSSTGGVPSTGGSTGMGGAGGSAGAGGTGSGGTSVPDGSADADDARDVGDARPDARDVFRDRAPDSPPDSQDVALDMPPDKPFVESDGSYFAEVPTGEAGSPLVLAWSDEFNGNANTGINVGKWSYVTWGPGEVNHEAQQYTSSTNNVFLDGAGHLVLRALYNPAAANPYTSGRIETKGKVAFGPGYHIEVRAQLPAGGGSFPGILLRGSSGTWPESGALGLMEQYGEDKSWFYSTAYAGDAAGSGKTDKTKYTFPDAITASADFHVYSLDWYWDHIVFQVDGQTILTTAYEPSSPFYSITEYIVLDLAVGGDMGGTIDNGAFPMEMLVDYVRVYVF